MSSVLEQQLLLLEEDAVTWKTKNPSSVKADRKRRRLEEALELEERQKRERAERREKNLKSLTQSTSDKAAAKANRKKAQAFEALQKKKPVKVNVQEAESTLEKTSLFDFDDEEGLLLEKKELEPVELDSDLQDSDDDDDDPNAPVKIFRFPDAAE